MARPIGLKARNYWLSMPLWRWHSILFPNRCSEKYFGCSIMGSSK
jgi:hypothetical protein